MPCGSVDMLMGIQSVTLTGYMRLSFFLARGNKWQKALWYVLPNFGLWNVPMNASSTNITLRAKMLICFDQLTKLLCCCIVP